MELKIRGLEPFVPLFQPKVREKGNLWREISLAIPGESAIGNISDGFADDKAFLLLLSRKRNQGILIDGIARIFIAEIRNNTVRIGIEARRPDEPNGVTVLRQEIIDEPKGDKAIEVEPVEKKGNKRGILVLSRKLNETLVFHSGNTEYSITVIEKKGTQVRLGIDAPQHVSVVRDEVWERNNGSPWTLPSS